MRAGPSFRSGAGSRCFERRHRSRGLRIARLELAAPERAPPEAEFCANVLRRNKRIRIDRRRIDRRHAERLADQLGFVPIEIVAPNVEAAFEPDNRRKAGLINGRPPRRGRRRLCYRFIRKHGLPRLSQLQTRRPINAKSRADDRTYSTKSRIVDLTYSTNSC